MKTKIFNHPTLFRLLAALFLLSLYGPPVAGQGGNEPAKWSGSVANSIKNENGNGGTGRDNPIQIASAEELAYLAQQVNAGENLTLDNGSSSIINGNNGSPNGFEGLYFALSADIDLSERYWTPIGNYTHPFQGNFDGQGHCVNGLKVEVTSSDKNVYDGLFGSVKNGILQNLGVRLAKKGIQVTVTDHDAYAGGIAGEVTGSTIRNCYVEGTGAVVAEVTAENSSPNIYAGGLVGYSSSSSITHCYATVDVEVGGTILSTDQNKDSSLLCHAGGIVGKAVSGTISYTYATGTVKATGTGNKLTNYVGGICGYVSTTLSHNLALNPEITGDEIRSNRIAGEACSSSDACKIESNYASPETRVNGNTITNGSATDVNGDANINYNNFASTLKDDDNDSEGWNSKAWSFDADNNLPQLQMITGYDTDGNPNDYVVWPGKPAQPTLLPSDFMTWIMNANGGDGKSWNSPILIVSAEELAYLARQVNTGANLTLGNETIKNGSNGSPNGFEGVYFALTSDIALPNRNWTPIGNDNHSFRGNFDGQGHCVSGLKVKVTSDTEDVYAGLFGKTEVDTLQNLGVQLTKEGIRATATGHDAHAGGIAGWASNVTIRNCYVTSGEEAAVVADVKVEEVGEYHSYAGGIVGMLDLPSSSSFSSLTHCYTTVDVKATGTNKGRQVWYFAGGIGGQCKGSISYTYATGSVKATGTGDGLNANFAGGICGNMDVGQGFSISNNLALNPEIKGGANYRIAGQVYNKGTLVESNYASPKIKVNDSSVGLNPDAKGLDGNDTWLDSFGTDLKGNPASSGWEKAWKWTDGNLPQLKMWKKEDADGNITYGDWSAQLGQPVLSTNAYLTDRTYLHIVPPTGGTLTVTTATPTDPAKPLNEGDLVPPGTLLTLSHTAGSYYRFGSFLSGASKEAMSDYSATTILMPENDLWLSARFSYIPPPPPIPVYYTVTLPAVEGAVTKPGKGNHVVEEGYSFRFYLTLDNAYDRSQPVVTTDRGDTLVPRASDGAYLVRNVYSDVEVYIEGVVKNSDPVANEAITPGNPSAAPQVWAERNTLCILIADDGTGNTGSNDAATVRPVVRILTAGGHLFSSFESVPGLTRRQLPAGLYIVQVGRTVRKVIVR